MQDGEPTETADETKAVADYYKVLNNMLSVFDLEKLYIPPQLDESQGLSGNQLLVEQAVLKELDLKDPEGSHLLDMGCGRERISYHFATLTGGRVSGYNIDANQIESAIDWAAECRMSDRLHFKVGNHHEPLEYESGTFDTCAGEAAKLMRVTTDTDGALAAVDSPISPAIAASMSSVMGLLLSEFR